MSVIAYMPYGCRNCSDTIKIYQKVVNHCCDTYKTKIGGANKFIHESSLKQVHEVSVKLHYLM